MEKPRVYIETTIPSAYFDERLSPEMVARREDTRRWWVTASVKYEMVTSMVVRDELMDGPPLRRSAWLQLINQLPLLDISPAVYEAAAAYMRHKLMPRRDVMHLALASYHRCDYLLTWNFKHLANANKLGHIQHVNARLGLFVPRILAPPALSEEGHE
jgi:predicted nucleic acid-binding protein